VYVIVVGSRKKGCEYMSLSQVRIQYRETRFALPQLLHGVQAFVNGGRAAQRAGKDGGRKKRGRKKEKGKRKEEEEEGRKHKIIKHRRRASEKSAVCLSPGSLSWLSGLSLLTLSLLTLSLASSYLTNHSRKSRLPMGVLVLSKNSNKVPLLPRS
jgi:hypothetical protein